jgi:preprotein translocase subunit SecD
MRQRDVNLLVFIILLSVALIWIALPECPGVHLNIGGTRIDYDLRLHQGLDLQGGLQVLLQADVPADQEANFDTGTMEAARVVVENRVNGLGVTEPSLSSCRVLQTRTRRSPHCVRPAFWSLSRRAVPSCVRAI